MRLNLSKIITFYRADIGAYVRGVLSVKITQFCMNMANKDKTIVASGGALFYDNVLGECTDRFTLQLYDCSYANLESGQEHFIQTNREYWPYRAETIDGVIMIHDLEFAENPEVYLRESWRVLKGEGKLLLIIPNRSGRWAGKDNTPFGQGHPFSIEQIQKLLSAAHFQIDAIDKALFFPPYTPKIPITRLYRHMVERLCGFYCMNAGVLVIEASKHVYAPTRGLKAMTADGARKMIMPKNKIGTANRSSKIE